MESRGNNHFPEQPDANRIVGNHGPEEPGIRNDLGRSISGFNEEGNVKPRRSFPRPGHTRRRNQPPGQR